ncbi:MAG: LCP family protein [Eubacteriales bacterium]|nr:LCP family protein [Eubacteriales bacterium]
MRKLQRRLWALMLALMLAISPCLAEETEPEPTPEEDAVVENPEEEEQFDDNIDSYLADKRAEVANMRHLLLIGIDARPGETTGRSDTMIIVTLDPDGNVIKLTSIMRDLYVEIPGRKNNRINATYVFGGPELLMETIELNFGVHIDHYIAVNFSMLGKLIDSIGGLTLTVENEYYMRRINAVIKQDNRVLGIDRNDQLLTEPGEQLMTGKQAQAYARYRYGTADGDFGRTVRQREIITKIFEKLNQMTAIELMGLVVDNFDNVYTNLSVSDLASYAPVLISMKDAEIQEMRLPIDGGYQSKTIAGMSVLVPNREKNMQALLEFLGE